MQTPWFLWWDLVVADFNTETVADRFNIKNARGLSFSFSFRLFFSSRPGRRLLCSLSLSRVQRPGRGGCLLFSGVPADFGLVRIHTMISPSCSGLSGIIRVCFGLLRFLRHGRGVETYIGWCFLPPALTMIFVDCSAAIFPSIWISSQDSYYFSGAII